MQHGRGKLLLAEGRLKEGIFRRNKFIGSPRLRQSPSPAEKLMSKLLEGHLSEQSDQEIRRVRKFTGIINTDKTPREDVIQTMQTSSHIETPFIHRKSKHSDRSNEPQKPLFQDDFARPKMVDVNVQASFQRQRLDMVDHSV